MDEGKTVEQERDEYLEGWKRALADYENLKRTTEKERTGWVSAMVSDVVSSFLPVYDYLQATLAKPPEVAGAEKWFEGVRHILTQFNTTLAEFNVVKLEVVGKPMNTNECEAVSTESDAAQDDGVVLREVQAGFALSDKVIRVAKVVVNEKI